jgi:hypothetical protein
MKKMVFTFLTLFTLLAGCTKKEPTRTSGIDTIDNTNHFSTTYFQYGFLFSGAKLVSTEATPKPDLVLYFNPTNSPDLTFQHFNKKPSYYKVGDFPDAASAQSAFDNLKTFDVSQWLDMADPVNNNQVWIYRSGTEHYAKIRIVSTINETRQTVAYGECTFQWVYQPDGSSTFPGK